jgi:hypothetical protein
MFWRHESNCYSIFISLNYRFLVLKWHCYGSNNLDMCIEKESKKVGKETVCVVRLWINYDGDEYVI